MTIVIIIIIYVYMIKISREELERLYHSMHNKDLCKKLQITNATLIRYLKIAGIKTKGKGNNEVKYRSKLEIT